MWFTGSLRVSHLKLCASRAFWLVAYPSQGHEILFDAHTRSFAALGGIPRRGIYDNMKTAVDKVLKGKGRTVNERFAAMCAHYLFDPDFCNVASGWEKGVVEKNVQDSRRRVWMDAGNQRFGSFIELNAWLGQRCRALWDEVRHPEYEQFSVAEVLEHEQAHLMPMTTPFDGYVEKPARVSSTCLVSVARNRYSVPCEWFGQRVSARLYPGSVVIVADDHLIAHHERLRNNGEARYDWQHYIPLLERKPGALRNGAPFIDMPEPLQRLRRGLLRHPGDGASAGDCVDGRAGSGAGRGGVGTRDWPSRQGERRACHPCVGTAERRAGPTYGGHLVTGVGAPTRRHGTLRQSADRHERGDPA